MELAPVCGRWQGCWLEPRQRGQSTGCWPQSASAPWGGDAGLFGSVATFPGCAVTFGAAWLLALNHSPVSHLLVQTLLRGFLTLCHAISQSDKMCAFFPLR